MNLPGRILIIAAFLLALLGGTTESRAAVQCLVGGVPQAPAPSASALEGYDCLGDMTIWSDPADPPDPDGVLASVAAIVNNGGNVAVAGNLTVMSGAVVKITNVTGFSFFNVGGNVTIATSAHIDLDGQAALPEPTGTGGAGRDALTALCGGSGAGYGAPGGGAALGSGSQLLPGGVAYGDPLAPYLPGSKGGRGRNNVGTFINQGGKGGGSFRLIAVGTVTVDGLISANGLAGQDWGGVGTDSVFLPIGGGGGGGSAGSILISAATVTTSLPGAVHLSATGGAGGIGRGGVYYCSDGAGGAGGRVATYYDLSGFTAAEMDCAGGPRGAGSNSLYTQNGGNGTCNSLARGIAPTAAAATPSSLGQGSPATLVSFTGTDIRAGATVEIDGSQLGQPRNGITITNVTAYPALNRVDAFVQVAHTAPAGAKPVRIINADYSASAPANLITVTAAPVVTEVRVDGVPGATAPRGFSYTVTAVVSGLQAGASLSFQTADVTVTGPAAVDTVAGTLSVPVTVSQSATAGNALFDVTNADGGTTQVPGVLPIESRPVVTGVFPDLLFAGQTLVPVRVEGSGFITGSTVNLGGTGVTTTATFNNFNQMTAWVSVPVETEVNLAETCVSAAVPGDSCRDLTVDNRDAPGAVSTAVPLNLSAPPAGTNRAELVLHDGTTQPRTRFWNGFGWSSPGAAGGVLAQPGATVLTDILTSGDMLAAMVDQSGALLFRSRTAGTWADASVPVTLPAAGQVVDLTALDATAGFLAAYGLPDGTLRYRTVFDGSGVDNTYVPAIPGCANDVANPVAWLRLKANRAGTQAMMAWARQDGTLCAAVWDGAAFTGETLLASAGLSTTAERAFDATWFGTTGEQAMVAWGASGSISLQSAVWDPAGAAWSTGVAQPGSGTPLAVIGTVRLASSHLSGRVALVNTTDQGELYGQVWSGAAWGSTGQELAAPMITAPDAMRAGDAAFDVAWSHTLDQAVLVYGVAGTYAPRARWWNPVTGWGVAADLPAPDPGPVPPVPLPDPRHVTVVADPASTLLLAGVVDWNSDAGRATELTFYRWDGAGWRALGVGSGLPSIGHPLKVVFERAAPLPPSVTSTTYNGVSPAAIGAQSTGQVLQIHGAGFMNPPTVAFSNPAIQVVNTVYRNATLLEVTVNIGPLAPGFQSVQVTNPNGDVASLTNALDVLAAPAITSVAATPANCVVSMDPGCLLQGASGVQVVVTGTGFVNGAQVVFDNPGMHITGSPVFGAGTLTVNVSVDGNAPPGRFDVSVVNPDSSTGVGAGMLVVERNVAVATVTPATAGVGAVSRQVTVTGTNFQPGVQFSFGAAVQVQSVTWQNSSQVVVGLSVAANAAPGDRAVTATNPDGGTATVSTPGFFTITPAPVVTGVTPGEGDQGAVVPVTVTGSGFLLVDPATGIAVSGDGVAVSAGTVVSDTQIQFNVAVAPDASFGVPRDVIITNTNGGRRVAAGAFNVRAVPVLTAITPSSAIAGEQHVGFTLTGTGFDPLASVLVGGGGVLVSQQYVSQLQIDLVLNLPGPANATVTVVNPDGRVAAPALPVTLGAMATCDAIGSGTVVKMNPASNLSCSSITVGSGATLVLLGDVTVNVTGNVLVQAGGTLRVVSSTGYTRLSVGGNLTVEATGAIDAVGTGYPGGHLGAPGAGPGGGAPSIRSLTGTDSGTGGGYGGRGGDGARAGFGGTANDVDGPCTRPNCLNFPAVPGSGGGSAYAYYQSGGVLDGHWWRAGGDGGGAVVLDVAGLVTVDGTISANGTDGLKTWERERDGFTNSGNTFYKGAGGGAGGSVLVMGNAVAGAGAISANGGNGSPLGTSTSTQMGTGGGGGRVAVFYRTGTAFTGTVSCKAGLQGGAIADPAWDGERGTCLNMPLPEILSITPPSFAQGAVGSATISGSNLVAGDTLRVLGTGVTGGTLATAGADFSAPVSVAVDAPIGARDVLVIKAGPSANPEANGFAIAFDGLEIGAAPRLLALTPSVLTRGQTVAATVDGTYLEPVGATLRFLQNGVEPMCAGPVACVSGALDELASGFSQLVIPALSVAPDAPVGAYDLELQMAGGGTAFLASGLVVRTANGSEPVITGVAPARAGEGATGVPVTLIGYDFSTLGVGTVSTITTSQGANVTIAPVAGGCLDVPAQCNTQPDGTQYLDVTVTSADLGLTGPLPVDITVQNALAAGSTLYGRLNVTPRPALTGIAPATGSGTFMVTASGSYIQPGATLSIDDTSGDGMPAIIGAITAPGDLVTAEVIVPAAKAQTDVAVRVTNPDGGFGTFTPLTLNPAPVITIVSPPTVAQGETAWLTLTGTGFHPDATVAINDPNLVGGVHDVTIWAVQRTSPTELRVQISLDASADRIPRDVTVTNPNGGTFTLAAVLEVVAPRILKIDNVTVNRTGLPAVGAGAQRAMVTISGTEFTGIDLRDIVFSNPGIHLLTTGTQSVFDPSSIYPASELYVYVREVWAGGVRFTSMTVPIRVDSSASVGTGTVTVRNPGGITASHPFTVNPAPNILDVSPRLLIGGHTYDGSSADRPQLKVQGSNIQPTPRACIGSGCDFGNRLTSVDVTAVTTPNSGLALLSVSVAPAASPGMYPLTLENPDGGRFTRANAVEVSAGFTVSGIVDTATRLDASEAVQGLTAAAVSLTGTNFTVTPAPAVAFLLPDGTVDAGVTATVVGGTATDVDLSLTVAAGAALGARAVRVTNGDGAVVEVPDFLLVASATGPTVGALQLPAAETWAGGNQLGLDAAGPRVVPGVVLTGSGFNPADFTLAFEDGVGSPWSGISLVPGWTVNAGGKRATFDLVLDPATPPGSVSVRVTSPAGQADVRANLFTVNPAPVVAAISPASGQPGEMNLSVRFDGAGFAPGVAVAATPIAGAPAGGVTPRDLDALPPAPQSPGNQAVWVDATSARALVDVSAAASGSYLLEAVNPDGGRAGLPFTISVAAGGGRAKIGYLGADTAAGNGLKVRDWDGGVLRPAVLSGTGGQIPHTTLAADLWNVVVANPMAPGQYLMAVGQATRIGSCCVSAVRTYRTNPDGTTWEWLDTTPATSADRAQAFDLAFEDGGAGNALLVYGGVDGRLYYKQIHNTGSGTADVTAAQEVRVGGVALSTVLSPIQWVRLVPRPGSQEILVTYLNNFGQLHAVIWDGAASAFVSQYGPGVVASGVGRVVGGRRKAAFDGAWQSQSGNAVVVWGQNNSNSLFAVTWDHAAWSAPVASGTAISGSGTVFVKAEADRSTDTVAVLAQIAYPTPWGATNRYEHALVSGFWGTGWSPLEVLALSTNLGEGPDGAANPERNQSPSAVANRNFDMAWDTHGKLVAMYTEIVGDYTIRDYRVRSRNWTQTQGWSTIPEEMQHLFPSRYIFGGATQALISMPVSIEVEADPWSDEMVALVLEGGTASFDVRYTSRVQTVFYRRTGDRWGGQQLVTGRELVTRWAEIANIAAGDGVSRHFGHAMDVAWEADRVPPSAFTLSEAGRSGGGVVVGWNAPGGDGATGRAGGYDLRWSSKQIIDCSVATVIDPLTQICFANAEQILPVPLPEPAGTPQSATINFALTAQDEMSTNTWYAALMAGDRDNRVDAATGAQSLWGNRSPMATVTINLDGGDIDPPGAITDLAVTAGPDPRTQAQLTWTGVGNDGSVTPGGPVFGYDVRIAPLPISEVGGPDNFEIPFDKVARSEFVSPALSAGQTFGVPNSAIITGLEPGTTYHFAAKGVDGNPGHYAPISNGVSITTAAAPLGVITDLSATAITSSGATLLWTAPDGNPTSYDLRISTSPIVDAASFEAAVRIPHVVAPEPAGTRQAYAIGGLASGTVHYAAMVPVRWEWVNGVLERRPAQAFRAGQDAVVHFTTAVDSPVGSTRPSAVNDLALVTGSVRTHEARLSWSAPQAAGGNAARYEFLWAHRPIDLAAPAEIHHVWVPLPPAAEGVAQEFTVTGLPENAAIYMVLLSYDGAGRASGNSNQVTFHTALRLGLNPISVPGQLADPNVANNLTSVVGSCVSGGALASGAGPVGPCGSGQTVSVSAWGWDPAGGADINGDLIPDGDFVALDPAVATLDPGGGVFVAASGTRSVFNVVGANLGSYPPVPLSNGAMTLVSNPHEAPVPVSSLIIHEAGGATWNFDAAVAASIIGPEMYFLTGSGGAAVFEPVVSGGQLLPQRAYFIRVLPGAVGTYSLEVP